MTKNGKMTKKEMFNAMLAKYEFTAEEKEFINHELELLARKNSAEKTMTKAQKENLEIGENLLETMEKEKDTPLPNFANLWALNLTRK